MGKTASGAIWLNEERLPAFDFWQFWRNTEDADVGRFLKLFTELPLNEIERLNALEGAEINQAKIILANEATRLCHGTEASAHAAQTAAQTFAEGKMADGLPTLTVGADKIGSLLLIDAFIEIGLAQSKGEVRRLIRGGGARLNNDPITDENRLLSADDFDGDGRAQISAGKKRRALLQRS
jgi:tyrosyl-tRNA synthetase